MNNIVACTITEVSPKRSCVIRLYKDKKPTWKKRGIGVGWAEPSKSQLLIQAFGFTRRLLLRICKFTGGKRWRGSRWNVFFLMSPITFWIPVRETRSAARADFIREWSILPGQSGIKRLQLTKASFNPFYEVRPGPGEVRVIPNDAMGYFFPETLTN
jgi:hypothetical protein